MEIKDFIKNKMELLHEEVTRIDEIDTTGNHTYEITTNKNKYILRLCGEKKRHRNKKEIMSEIKLMNFLKLKSIPAPVPIKIGDNVVMSLGNKNGILCEVIKGNVTNNPTLKQCYAVGKLLGEIHIATTNYKFCHERKKWGLNQTIKKFKEIENILLKDKYLQKNNFSERVKFILNEINFNENLPKGAIHEDLGKRHILFKNNEINGILDWDRSYFNFLILDLGQTIRGWCFDNCEELDQDKFINLLSGYENQRNLSKTEKYFLLDAIRFAFIERAIAFVLFSYNMKTSEYKKYAVNNIDIIEKLIINLD